MNIEDIRKYCISKKGATEEFPFGEDTLVFKVMGRIFLISGLDSEVPSFNVKCDPGRAADLRESYPGIIPGYHMNKRHWNTVLLDGSLPSAMLRDMIDHSYALVAAGLGKAEREALQKL